MLCWPGYPIVFRWNFLPWLIALAVAVWGVI